MKVLLTEEEIRKGIDKLAQELNGIYGDSPITVVAIITGSIVMLSDLIRRLEMPLRISLIQASSYRGGTTSGELTIRDEMMLDIRDRHVLLLDDIFDTGQTLLKVSTRLQTMAPRSMRTAVFLSKTGSGKVQMRPDHTVFEIPNEFVVGYGLDFADYYRNLPFVGILEEHDLANRVAH